MTQEMAVGIFVIGQLISVVLFIISMLNSKSVKNADKSENTSTQLILAEIKMSEMRMMGELKTLTIGQTTMKGEMERVIKQLDDMKGQLDQAKIQLEDAKKQLQERKEESQVKTNTLREIQEKLKELDDKYKRVEQMVGAENLRNLVIGHPRNEKF